jgi:hypothetical protein
MLIVIGSVLVLRIRTGRLSDNEHRPLLENESNQQKEKS